MTFRRTPTAAVSQLKSNQTRLTGLAAGFAVHSPLALPIQQGLKVVLSIIHDSYILLNPLPNFLLPIDTAEIFGRSPVAHPHQRQIPGPGLRLALTRPTWHSGKNTKQRQVRVDFCCYRLLGARCAEDRRYW